MTRAWAWIGLGLLVGVLLAADRRGGGARFFRWLPVPLWCYALPMLAVTVGGLPRDPASYQLLTNALLPLALVLLLLGVDVRMILRSSGHALLAAAIGAAGVVVGALISVWSVGPLLPAEAWKGAGALVGTWTGGTMNLLALRAILGVPEEIFAPLILVDAMTAYGWMAVLMAASAYQPHLNRWLHATDDRDAHESADREVTAVDRTRGAFPVVVGLALLISLASRHLSARIPATALVSGSTGWTVLLVTTISLGLSLIPALRRLAGPGHRWGQPCLYLVLAATGAQASLEALRAAPAWVLVGLIVVLCHGLLLMLAGRWLRIPISVLATASQANLGGVVSAPLVASVYHRSLAPLGLLLAVAGNALGTYLGWLAAAIAHRLIA